MSLMDEHPVYDDAAFNRSYTIHRMNLEFIISAIRQIDDTLDAFDEDPRWSSDDEQNRRELLQSLEFLRKVLRG